MRVFAHRYPELTAGIVLCDPTDEDFMDYWLRQHYPHVNRISPLDRARRNEKGSIPESFEQARQAWPLPSVPLVLLTGMSDKGEEIRKNILPVWRDYHSRFVSKVPRGRHIVLESSGHGIPFEEPDVVARVIQEVIEQVK